MARRDVNDSSTWSLPQRLSPSRLSDFANCPRKFYYKSVVGLPDPAGIDALRGTLTHRVIELLFDRPRDERTVATARSLIEPVWVEVCEDGDGYEHLLHCKEQLLPEVTALVERYFSIEAPQRFDPHALEIRAQAKLCGVDIIGVLDRLDRHVDDAGVERWYISDLKTGKIPSGRYLDKAFFAMRVYALLVKAELNVDVHALRLVYLKGDSPEKAIRTLVVDDKVLRRAERELATLVRRIQSAAETGEWETNTGPLCNWCPYQQICPEFATDPSDGPVVIAVPRVPSTVLSESLP